MSQPKFTMGRYGENACEIKSNQERGIRDGRREEQK